MCARHRGSYWTYLVTNERNGTLCVGVTNSIQRRIWQHKAKQIEGFTKQYGLNLLAYFEEFRDPTSAISREKEINGWLRRKKLA